MSLKLLKILSTALMAGGLLIDIMKDDIDKKELDIKLDKMIDKKLSEKENTRNELESK